MSKIKSIVAAGAVAVAALTLAACTSAPTTHHAATPKPTAIASTPATPAPVKTQTPAPKPVDPRTQAQQASGLTTAAYAKVSADAMGVVHSSALNSMTAFESALAPVEKEAGKPVVIVFTHQCYDDPSRSDWAYVGALHGYADACGEEWAASETAAIAHVKEMASSDIATENGYVMVVQG